MGRGKKKEPKEETLKYIRRQEGTLGLCVVSACTMEREREREREREKQIREIEKRDRESENRNNK